MNANVGTIISRVGWVLAIIGPSLLKAIQDAQVHSYKGAWSTITSFDTVLSTLVVLAIALVTKRPDWFRTVTGDKRREDPPGITVAEIKKP